MRLETCPDCKGGGIVPFIAYDPARPVLVEGALCDVTMGMRGCGRCMGEGEIEVFDGGP